MNIKGIDQLHVYKAHATPTEPLCVNIGDVSLTIWQRDDGSVAGFLCHTYKDDQVESVVGAGVIPAEYVAFEENARIWSQR